VCLAVRVAASNMQPKAETVADFRERIAILMRERETGKRYSHIGASRAPECVLRRNKKQPTKGAK